MAGIINIVVQYILGNNITEYVLDINQDGIVGNECYYIT